MGDQASLPNYMATLNALHHRNAVLETNLAQAMSEKMAAEHATQYVLKLIATNRCASVESSGHEEKLRLEREIRVLNAENANLRMQLHESILHQEMPLRSRDATHSANPDTGTSSTYPIAVSREPSSVLRRDPTLVDLMDLEELPGLDHSAGSSTSDDDLEQLNKYVQTPPRIDFVTKARDISNQHTDSEQNTHFVRRFLQDSFEGTATQASEEHSSNCEQHSIPNDQPIGKTSQVYSDLQETTANSFLDRILAERVYSMDHYTEAGTWSHKFADSEKNLDIEVLPGKSVVTTLQIQPEEPCSPKQESATANETKLSITERHGNTAPSEQLSTGATCGPSELFSSRADREHAIKEHQFSAGFQECRFPDMFRYGIRYEPPANQTNIFKMVSIMNLPTDISLNELMSKIRGGTVVSCRLLDTTKITGRFSALVRFLHEHEALAYDEFAAAHPIVFRGSRAYTAMVKTPSWPLSLPHDKAIFNHQHTRCLEVVNFPRKISPAQLTRDLRYGAIEHKEMRKDGILELRFASIDHAGRAYGLLTTSYTYRQCGISFGKDPCTLPLDTLIEPLEEGHDGGINEFVHQLNGDEKKNLLAYSV
ncbi:hypothetical protein MMC11_005366 [Xylographa trunciseda]|nr:hypothetical protein [Xylographa trunciseda]